MQINSLAFWSAANELGRSLSGTGQPPFPSGRASSDAWPAGGYQSTLLPVAAKVLDGSLAARAKRIGTNSRWDQLGMAWFLEFDAEVNTTYASIRTAHLPVRPEFASSPMATGFH